MEAIPVEAEVHVDIRERDGLVGECCSGLDELLGMSAITPRDRKTMVDEPTEWIIGAKRQYAEHTCAKLALDAGKNDCRCDK